METGSFHISSILLTNLDNAMQSCFANGIGRDAGENIVVLEANEDTTSFYCEGGSVILIILKRLGLFGEHNRVDRDKYIKVHLENLEDPEMNNDYRIETFTNRYISVPYDYYSITHYAKNANAKEGTIVIETLDPAFQNIIGQNTDQPTARDYEKIKVLYQCIQP
ncbi:unnamed protein product [Cylicocyclus nassatus]|uniref:Metalloendopeptidase n=1 Tax=Cylicocyclus nassatus TaxID=53992 RepID=A0AA36GE89_CYLNA|nr:unnamed protein product [Cylicocyclus nassatus]